MCWGFDFILEKNHSPQKIYLNQTIKKPPIGGLLLKF